MSFRQTDEHLEKMLLNEGFQTYPAQPNKYWNEDGRILWTDGDLYKVTTSDSWSSYKKQLAQITETLK